MLDPKPLVLLVIHGGCPEALEAGIGAGTGELSINVNVEYFAHKVISYPSPLSKGVVNLSVFMPIHDGE